MQNLSFRPEHSLPARKGMHSGGTCCSPARTRPCFREHNFTTSAAPWKSAASAPRKLVKDQNLSFRPEHSLPARKGMHSGGTCCSPTRTRSCFRGHNFTTSATPWKSAASAPRKLVKDQNLSFRPEHSPPARKGMHSGGTRCSPARTRPYFREHNFTTSAAPRKLVKDQFGLQPGSLSLQTSTPKRPHSTLCQLL
jgi:hypothetical protein